MERLMSDWIKVLIWTGIVCVGIFSSVFLLEKNADTPEMRQKVESKKWVKSLPRGATDIEPLGEYWVKFKLGDRIFLHENTNNYNGTPYGMTIIELK